jgi:eight-cysteine-cluster-containing protein
MRTTLFLSTSLIFLFTIIGCTQIEDTESDEFCTSPNGAKLSYVEAVATAESSECNSMLKETHYCNNITGTWWMDLNIDKPGCSPACVVIVETKKAEINWRCTGAIIPNTAEFCGRSTYGVCKSVKDCIKGGCSSSVCQSAKEEPIITTCEWRDCYDSAKYGLVCGCKEGKCQWMKE